jgi:hypothetical protein
MIPLILKGTFRPGRFVIGPLVGAYVTLPLGDYRSSVPLGFLAGADLGMHVGGNRKGHGIVFLDIRYAHHFGDTVRSNNDSSLYKRSMVSLSAGYRWGLMKVEKK